MARAHVILSDDVLEAVDEIVGKRGRSRFIDEAAREKLERLRLVEALEATSGITRGRAYRHWRDDRETVAWVQGARRTESSG